MKQLFDSVWQRCGISWLTDPEALAMVTEARKVWSLRQLLRTVNNWPEDLPSNNGEALVVAGLEGSLDLLSPDECELWLGGEIKDAILSFQGHYEGQAALVFWLPGGAGRFTVNAATDAVQWRCAPPNNSSVIDFGRVLWGEAREYPQEIVLRRGERSSGLFHLRIT